MDADISVSDDDLQAYYDAHQERYERPEQVRLEYVLIDRQAMAEGRDVDEEALRDAWREKNRNADRRVSHIMITFGNERTRDEAQQLAETAREALDSGDSFTDTALRYSDDTASAEEGGDLGVISRGFFGEAFDEAAFGLEEGDVSQPVELDNAFHIIQVTDIQGPTFEEQRDELAREVALRDIDDEFNQRVQQLIDESFAADDLQSVADELGLTLQESDWLARDDEADGVLSEPGVMSAAFSNDVFEEGYNSEVIELDQDRRLVLRVAEQRDATLLPLDEVREDVEMSVAAEQQQEALREEAQALVASLRDGQSADVDWLEANSVSRQADSTVPQLIVQEAFRMERPEEGESVYRTVELPQGVAVVALDSVSVGEVDEQMETFVAQMAEQLRAQSVLQGLIDDLRSDADIER